MLPRRPSQKPTDDPNQHLRDVVALAVLPAMWSGAEPARVAESLAAALFANIGADFVYVSLLPGGGHPPLTIAQTDRYSTDPVLAEKYGPDILAWSRGHDPDELLVLPNPKGPGELRILAYALGLNAELGVVAAGFLDEGSPTDFNKVLLSVGASQAATATNNIGLLQSLRQYTDQFKTLFNQSPLGIYLVDSSFRIREMNPVALRTFGDVPGGFIGRDLDVVLRILWDDSFADEIARIFRRTLETGEPYSTLERAERRRDRDAIESYEWRADRITLPDGGFGVLCHFRDISAEALARLKTAESEERFRALVTASTDTVYSMSPDWQEVRHLDGSDLVSDRYEPSQSWIDQYLHPDDKEGVLKSVDEAISREGLFEVEHRVLRTDGSVGWTYSRAVPIRGPDGKIREWFGAASDVTRRRTAESALDATQAEIERQRRLYEAILTNTPDLAYVWDLDHRFTYANDGLLAMWGKTREEAIGKNCLELGYEPWHAAMHDRDIEEVIATKKPVRGEVPFAGAFGRRIYDYILVPVLGPDGTVEAVAGTTRDVTEYRLVEERLREGDRLKDEFIATLAHELRNPLSPIRTGLELIKLTNGDAVAVEKTRTMMERQVEQLVALVDDLLDVSRIAQDKLDLHREPINVADVVQVAVETVKPLIDRLGHKLTVRLPQRSITVDADPNRIAQILSNLLSNAAKYTSHGGHIELTVEAEKQDLLVSVQDDGIGIPAEMLSRIFEMFAQIDRPLEKGDTGLGIGLTLVKSLVELHGGTISAHSAGRNKGTEFRIRVPIVLDVGRPKETSEEDVEEIMRSKVLVVDDNQAGAEMLTMLVQMLGSEVRIANDGQQAVEMAAEFQPDIVLMDLGMPRMDGYDAARFMRRQPWGADITLVALTGWGQDEDKQRTKEAGFDIHIVKPVDPATLRSILTTHPSRNVDG